MALNGILTSRDWEGDFIAEHIELENAETVFSFHASIEEQEEPHLLSEYEPNDKQMAPRKSLDPLNFLSEELAMPLPDDVPNTMKGTDWDDEYNHGIFISSHANSEEELARQAGIIGEENSNHTPIPVSVGGAPVPSLPTSMDLSVFPPSSPLDATKTERLEIVPLKPPSEPVAVARAALVPPITTKKGAATTMMTTTTTTTKKRMQKKPPRRSKEPTVKLYVEPTNLDVLLGRGGRSNHHPGNKKYRDEVQNLQKSYKASSKNEKTDLSQRLVDFVHGYGGRFLKLEQATKQWYIVLNIVARRKASQALREHLTPEERAEKKAQQTVQQEG